VNVDCFITVETFSINKQQVKDVIAKLTNLENPQVDGEIRIIFVDNKKIHSLNKDYLNHDYPTDVIAFPIEKANNFVEGEIYISIDEATKQASELNISQNEEIWRLLIHGVLHLLEYDDQLIEQRIAMKKKEDFYLTKFGLTARRLG
jgi:rRNA maturation RNase YbeY